MTKIVGVRFRPVGKLYYFSPKNLDLQEGEGVIVETARGVEFGRVVLSPREIEDEMVTQPLKPVLRKATNQDYLQAERQESRKESAMIEAKKRIEKHKLDMKLIDCEFTFDNSKVLFYYTSDHRVDFRELVKDLAGHFRVRIELRQIRSREATKMLGGLAPCGRPCCCASHLDDFTRVSIKMAKTQCLSLNPTKISGLCGRLMCCLAYENDHYAETAKKMPVVGASVETPDGRGVVVSNNLLRQITRVKFQKKDESWEFKEYPADQIKASKTLADKIAADAGKDDDVEE